MHDIKELAEKGVAEAQYALGSKYLQSNTPEDNKEGIKWYRRAAEQGHIQAQLNLGNIYEIGYEALQDYKEAIKWYRKAAEQVDTKGQLRMGIMYEYGKGVTKNCIEAHKWYNIAGANGMVDGMEFRDRVGKKMTPLQIVEAQKLAREWMEEHQKN